MANKTADDLLFDPPAPRRWRRRALVALAVAAVAAGSVLGYQHFSAAQKPTITYKTSAATVGAVEKTVTATGTLSPRVTVSVGSQVSGRILALYADFNSHVKKGQVIAKLDPTSIRADYARVQADLSAARARLSKAIAAEHEALAKYKRDKKLQGQKIVAPAEVETRLMTYQSAKAETISARAGVAQAKASLAKAKDNLANTTISSPIDGIVVSRSVDVGQTVAASLSAPTLFSIAQDLSKMEVHTSVAESDVGQLRAGMPVRFSVDAYPNTQFDGVVKQVRYEPQTVQNVVTYDAVVSVDNAELKLRPGMTTNVTFVIDARADVLRVPTTALRFRPAGASSKRGANAGKAQAAGKAAGNAQAASNGKANGKARANAAAARKGKKGARARSLYVLRDGKPLRLRVQTGLSDGALVEVKSDALKAGDQVITSASQPAGAAAKGKAKSASSTSRAKSGRGRRRGVF